MNMHNRKCAKIYRRNNNLISRAMLAAIDNQH